MENSKKVIRNIPIYIEGRDEHILNRDHDDVPDQGAFRQNFTRSKTPEKSQPTSTNNFSASHSVHTATPPSSSSDNVAQKTQSVEEPIMMETPPPHVTQKTQDQKNLETSIEKIYVIQKSVMDLMQKIEAFNGDRKEYAYLDEMLTQQLIKLDNIETNIDVEGRENLRNSKKEVIKCCNALINLLEEKYEQFKSNEHAK